MKNADLVLSKLMDAEGSMTLGDLFTKVYEIKSGCTACIRKGVITGVLYLLDNGAIKADTEDPKKILSKCIRNRQYFKDNSGLLLTVL